MAAATTVNSIKGKEVLIYISTNLTTPAYKALVCLINGGLSGTRDVNTQSTKCGTAKAGGEPNYTVTGSLAANTAPDTAEMTAEDLIALFDTGDSFLFKIAHETTPADYYRQGTGFFSSYNETSNDGELVTADFTIEVEGGIDITP